MTSCLIFLSKFLLSTEVPLTAPHLLRPWVSVAISDWRISILALMRLNAGNLFLCQGSGRVTFNADKGTCY